MRFEWDPAKARANLAKHRVAFEDAQCVWNDPLHLVIPDRVESFEQRWHAIGMVGSVTLLLVVHTYPNEDDGTLVRIVGARKATPHERRRYEQENT
jgi:uncharacterized DUF497 family protein